MNSSPIDVHSGKKLRKLPPPQRKAQVLALTTAGITQEDIASKLGVSRSTIVKDLQDLRPAAQATNNLLGSLVSEYEDLQSPKDIAGNYVQLAKQAKNEAVRLAAQDRILEHRGVITDKERMRRQVQEPQAPQPMFVLPAGCNVAVTFGTSIYKDAAQVEEQALREARVINKDAASKDGGSLEDGDGVPPR